MLDCDRVTCPPLFELISAGQFLLRPVDMGLLPTFIGNSSSEPLVFAWSLLAIADECKMSPPPVPSSLFSNHSLPLSKDVTIRTISCLRHSSERGENLFARKFTQPDRFTELDLNYTTVLNWSVEQLH